MPLIRPENKARELNEPFGEQVSLAPEPMQRHALRGVRESCHFSNSGGFFNEEED